VQSCERDRVPGVLGGEISLHVKTGTGLRMRALEGQGHGNLRLANGQACRVLCLQQAALMTMWPAALAL
jgi:hypothetical protein